VIRIVHQLKKLAFLTPKQGMGNESFRRYWREVHGPLVALTPDYAQWRRRYVQNHVRGPGPVGSAFAYGGMAAFWLPGDSPNEDAFGTTPLYRDRIRLDELNFIDMDRTVSITATEQVVRPGRGDVKVVVLSRRSAGIAADDFERRYASDYVDAVLSRAACDRWIRGWCVNHVLEGSFRLPGARAVSALPIDCIEEIWFSSEDDIGRAFDAIASTGAVQRFTTTLFAEDRSSFQAEEFVFFDEGEPTPLATGRPPGISP
jgi:uncharacterized protein (TIGR02118 family)